VLPDYRSRGLGAALVSMLTAKLAERADFTTVGGALENSTDPQALYRRCGYSGRDVWWLLQRF